VSGGTIVETERLIVRHLEARDVEPLAALWSDPGATTYLGGPRTAEAVRRSLQEDLALPQPPTFDLWPTIEKTSGRLVGHCGLLDKEVAGVPEVELVYVLAPAAWGRGLATEAGQAIRDHAVRALGRKRLIALIHPDNAASERVVLKLGFRQEGEVERPRGRLRLYGVALG
jgi:RimJ/RimL family protein N-acetyltransferase